MVCFKTLYFFSLYLKREFTGSFLPCLYQSKPKLGSQSWSPIGWQGSKCLNHHLLPPRVCTNRKPGSEWEVSRTATIPRHNGVWPSGTKPTDTLVPPVPPYYKESKRATDLNLGEPCPEYFHRINWRHQEQKNRWGRVNFYRQALRAHNLIKTCSATEQELLPIKAR